MIVGDLPFLICMLLSLTEGVSWSMMFNTGFLHSEVLPLIYGASFVFGSLADAVEPEVICPHLLPFPPSGSSFWR